MRRAHAVVAAAWLALAWASVFAQPAGTTATSSTQAPPAATSTALPAQQPANGHGGPTVPPWLVELIKFFAPVVASIAGVALMLNKYIKRSVAENIRAAETTTYLDLQVNGLIRSADNTTYIRDRVLEALRTPDAQTYIVAAVNTEGGRDALAEVITHRPVWAKISVSLIEVLEKDPQARAAIGSIVTSALLDTDDARDRIVAALRTNAAQEAITAALNTPDAAEAIAKALITERARAEIAAALASDPVQQKLIDVLAFPQVQAAIIANADVSTRVLDMLRTTEGVMAVTKALENGIGHLAFLALLEQNDVRERIFRWLESDQGREQFRALLQGHHTEIIADVTLAGLVDEKKLDRLRRMIGESLTSADPQQLIAAYEAGVRAARKGAP